MKRNVYIEKCLYRKCDCLVIGTNISASLKNGDVRIDVGGDEGSDLLGEIVMTGNLTPQSTGLSSKLTPPVEVSARLTTKTFFWGLRHLHLDDIVAVSMI